MSPLMELTIPADINTISINHAIKKAHISQSMRRKLRHNGQFLCNGNTCTWDTLLHGGDHLIVHMYTHQDIHPYSYPLDIVYEDEHLLVINKPTGLLMHPTSTERYHTVANAIIHYFESTEQSASFHPVHRLDKDTSGLVVIAKNALVQHTFMKQQTHFQKTYDAIVGGILPFNSASIGWPISRKEGSIIERCCNMGGKAARTDIHRIATYKDYTHIQCLLHTGRTHQIRVHLSHLGYPLLGDDIYGGHLQYIKRQALHASRLSFVHPITNETLHLYGPLPEDLSKLL